MRINRRQFIKGLASAGMLVYGSRWFLADYAFSSNEKSQIFEVQPCPIHDGQLRHQGVDMLLELLAANHINFYTAESDHTWGGPEGLIAPDDVVLIKINSQWKCRGTTNTDVLRGLIHRILQHPDGFRGEVVILENGQGRGGFDGVNQGGSAYDAWPHIANGIWVNAEAENLLTVDYLVHTVFEHDPVSSYLLDPVQSIFISETDHLTDGYRKFSDISYPCFTSQGGHRIELHEGIWNGSGHDLNLKLINLPVLKHDPDTGITGALKNMYGILSLADGSFGLRRDSQSGIQSGKIWSLVENPILNILDCIWVSPDDLRGFPPETTYRADTLLAGFDPVALDYYASKHILYPLGGAFESEHDPDSFPELVNQLDGAMDIINSNGGVEGKSVQKGDENIAVFRATADPADSNEVGPADDDSVENNSRGSSTYSGYSCFITTAADR